jgi:hypothetical protein
VAEADVPFDAVLGDRLAQVREDGLAVGDRLGVLPRLEGEAEGVHVRVGADARIAEEVPRSADVLARLEDGVRAVGAARLQVVAGADAGDPGADHQHVEVLALHRAFERSIVKRAGHTTPWTTGGLRQRPFDGRSVSDAQFALAFASR